MKKKQQRFFKEEQKLEAFNVFQMMNAKTKLRNPLSQSCSLKLQEVMPTNTTTHSLQ